MSEARQRKRLAVVPPDGGGEDRPKPPVHSPKAASAGAGGGRAHGPYARPPRGLVLLPAERTPLLAEALKGVRLHAFDRRAVDWLCRQADTPTFLALLGLLHRARQAAADRAAAAAGERAAPEPAGPPPRHQRGAR